MYILEMEKQYGIGVVTMHRRGASSFYEANIYQRAMRDADNYRCYHYTEEEKQRLRATKSKTNSKTRALSFDFKYFSTFTTSNSELARNGKELLNVVCNELKLQNTYYFAQLEVFDNSDEFHVHVLSDKQIYFDNFIYNYGAIKEDLYSKEIYSTQEDCVDYINKKIAETKLKLKDLYHSSVHVYKSNVKKVKAGTIIRIIDDETGEVFVVFDNTESIKTKENSKEKKKSVLKVEKHIKKIIFCIISSNTGNYVLPIPCKIAKYIALFNDFLLKFVGWVENIPANKQK